MIALNVAVQFFQRVLGNIVIAVHEQQILSSGGFDPGIPGSTQSLVLLMDHPDLFRAGSLQFVAQIRTDTVGTAVIHENHFVIVELLIERGINAFTKVFCHVIYRNNYTYLHAYASIVS